MSTVRTFQSLRTTTDPSVSLNAPCPRFVRERVQPNWVDRPWKYSSVCGQLDSSFTDSVNDAGAVLVPARVDMVDPRRRRDLGGLEAEGLCDLVLGVGGAHHFGDRRRVLALPGCGASVVVDAGCEAEAWGEGEDDPQAAVSATDATSTMATTALRPPIGPRVMDGVGVLGVAARPSGKDAFDRERVAVPVDRGDRGEVPRPRVEDGVGDVVPGTELDHPQCHGRAAATRRHDMDTRGGSARTTRGREDQVELVHAGLRGLQVHLGGLPRRHGDLGDAREAGQKRLAPTR